MRLFQGGSVTSENTTQAHLNRYIISFFKVIIEVFFQKVTWWRQVGSKQTKTNCSSLLKIPFGNEKFSSNQDFCSELWETCICLVQVNRGKVQNNPLLPFLSDYNIKKKKSLALTLLYLSIIFIAWFILKLLWLDDQLTRNTHHNFHWLFAKHYIWVI